MKVIHIYLFKPSNFFHQPWNRWHHRMLGVFIGDNYSPWGAFHSLRYATFTIYCWRISVSIHTCLYASLMFIMNLPVYFVNVSDNSSTNFLKMFIKINNISEIFNIIIKCIVILNYFHCGYFITTWKSYFKFLIKFCYSINQ